MGKTERRGRSSEFGVVALVCGLVLVASACEEDESSPRGNEAGGAETGGELGTGGKGDAATGGKVDAPTGTAGEGGTTAVGPGAFAGEGGTAFGPGAFAGEGGSAVGSGAAAGAGGESDVGGSGGAPLECWAESAAGAPGLGFGGEGGVPGGGIGACADRGCDALEACGRSIGLCGGCTPVGFDCSCECYQRFSRCASCGDFAVCMEKCTELGC